MFAVAVGLLTGVAAVAQAQMSTFVAERFAALPNTVAGLNRSDGGYNAPLASYGGKGVEPLVVIALVDAGSAPAKSDMAAAARGSVAPANLMQTLFEGRFAIPDRPAARTYFGDFLTEQGVKQVWIADYDGTRTMIVATIYRSADRRPVFDAIRKDLLRGAAMTSPSTSVRN